MALAHLGGAGGRDHELVKHLRDVASRARDFASRARKGDESFAAMAEWAGWLHDLGKYRTEFQDYLQGRRSKSEQTQHAVFGAARAAAISLPCAVSLAILGHHAGLPSMPGARDRLRNPAVDPLGTQAELGRQLESELGADASLPATVAEFLSTRRGLEATYGQDLLIRMLFSCLVDADFLDTEVHVTGRERDPSPVTLGELSDRLASHVRLLGELSEATDINRARSALHEGCLAAAKAPPGLFRLTAPTGSGKTLAMLAFALEHARTWQLDRVIVVLPFLAIIEQNARVYREALGLLTDPRTLVEHHSAVKVSGVDKEPAESESATAVRAKQAIENWDAPVVVTTAVQFLESLFARSPRACRKLHNIARSVVVFDEVQTLPFPLLDPILSALGDLRDTFGVSFLLGSATQPKLERSTYLPCGFEPGGTEGREIVADREGLFSVFRRARLELPCLESEPWTWDDVGDRLASESQALIIVNLRKHAQDLFETLRRRKIAGLFHLSSTMCAAHREKKLGRKDAPESGSIYHALANGKPCVVVSTQVVEAGVDLDFPIVFRAEGPLDGVIQAAGRCDREGKLTRAAGRPAGRVVVFRPAAVPATPRGYYEFATEKARGVLAEHAGSPQRILDDPQVFASYHQALIDWAQGQQSAARVQAARRLLDYPRVAELFQIIDEAGQGVVVQYGAAVDLIDEIRRRLFATAADLRALQRYTVNLYPNWVSRLQADLRPLFAHDGAPIEYVGPYHDDLGIVLGELPPESFCIAN